MMGRAVSDDYAEQLDQQRFREGRTQKVRPSRVLADFSKSQPQESDMNIATHPFDALMEITARPPVVFVRGEGSLLWDDSGKRYLDFVQGWAVNCLGHSPPMIAEALTKAGKIAADAEPGLFQRPELEARKSAGRSKLLRPGVLRQFGRGSQ
jgi:4-aminobutyrate aminotransferase-like enzyme